MLGRVRPTQFVLALSWLPKRRTAITLLSNSSVVEDRFKHSCNIHSAIFPSLRWHVLERRKELLYKSFKLNHL